MSDDKCAPFVVGQLVTPVRAILKDCPYLSTRARVATIKFCPAQWVITLDGIRDTFTDSCFVQE